MKENQWLLIRSIAARATFDAPLLNIPVGYVVSRVTNNTYFRKDSRYQIHPALIGEQSALQVHITMVIQPFLPPTYQSNRCCANPKRNESKLIRTPPHHFNFPRLPLT